MENLINELDNSNLSFCFNIEKTIEKGEDADPVLLVEGKKYFISVFDGMGGAGSTVYSFDGVQRSGAFIASRTVKKTLERLLHNIIKQNEVFDEKITETLKNEVLKDLNSQLKELKHEVSALKSKLIKTLPTTFAGQLIYEEEKEIKVFSFSAGDSRNYILSPQKGLSQLSKDDLKENFDAFENITKDAQMSNFIHIEGDFKINLKEYSFDNQECILISATDGCFGYFPTPLHFENIILNSISSSDTISECKDLLIENIKEVAGDDFSLSFLPIGFGSFNGIKESFKARLEFMYQDNMKTLEEEDKKYEKLKKDKIRIEEDLKHQEKFRIEAQTMFWEEYKKNYELYKSKK